MNKMDELLARLKVEQEMESKKKACPLTIILAIIGGIALIGAIAYAVYNFFAPDYIEELDFDDEDFEDFDDYFENDDDDEEEEEAEESAEDEE